MTPRRSAAQRFCEIFHLPLRRVIGISMPTIAFNILSMYSTGASLTRQDRAARLRGDS